MTGILRIGPQGDLNGLPVKLGPGGAGVAGRGDYIRRTPGVCDLPPSIGPLRITESS